MLTLASESISRGGVDNEPKIVIRRSEDDPNFDAGFVQRLVERRFPGTVFHHKMVPLLVTEGVAGQREPTNTRTDMVPDPTTGRFADGVSCTAQEIVIITNVELPQAVKQQVKNVLQNPASGGAMDLEVPVEQLDKGVSSQTTDKLFDQGYARVRKYTSPDDAEFDGTKTYDWEIIAENVNAANGYDVELLDGLLNIVSTITVPANSAITRYRNAGVTHERDIRLRLKGTGANNDVRVYTSRFHSQQTGATKTMPSIPLIQNNGRDFDNGPTSAVDLTASTTYTQAVSDDYSLWLRTDADWDAYTADEEPFAGDRPFFFEAVLLIGGAGPTAFASLFNKTDNAQVTASEVSTTGVGWTPLYVEVSKTATNFHDGDEHEVRIRTSDGAQSCQIALARLHVRIKTAAKAEVYYRFVKQRAAGIFGPSLSVAEQRILYDASLFSGPTVYHESTGRDSFGTDGSIALRDHDLNDTGTNGANVAGSEINYASSTKQRVRTSAITPDSGDRFIFRGIYPGSGLHQALSTHSWLVVAATGAAPVAIVTHTPILRAYAPASAGPPGTVQV